MDLILYAIILHKSKYGRWKPFFLTYSMKIKFTVKFRIEPMKSLREYKENTTNTHKRAYTQESILSESLS